MSSLAHAVRDSRTMLRRNLRRARRYPSMTFVLIAIPVVFLLLFVYVFGGTIGAGLDGPAAGGGRAEYANYVTPGILLLSVATGATGTAASVAIDMTEGIIARFKTMAIYRPSVLAGHVLGAVIQTLVGLAVVLGVAVAVGFRPAADPVDWLAALVLLTGISFAISWLSVACGLFSKTVEGASNLPMPLILLPFLGSGFVPTDSMPTAVRIFADHQPFTPIMETLRGLLTGTAIGADGWLSAAWCAALTVAGYLWAKKLYDRDPSR